MRIGRRRSFSQHFPPLLTSQQPLLIAHGHHFTRRHSIDPAHPYLRRVASRGRSRKQNKYCIT